MKEKSSWKLKRSHSHHFGGGRVDDTLSNELENRASLLILPQLQRDLTAANLINVALLSFEGRGSGKLFIAWVDLFLKH